MLPWCTQHNGCFKIFRYYGSIPEEKDKRQKSPLEPERGMDFELLKNNFYEWLRVWKMTVPEGYPYKADLVKFAQKTKARLTALIKKK